MTFKQENFLTPSVEMYERNHNLIPQIEAEDYELDLLAGGKGDENPISLGLEDLKRMPSHEVISTIACAGNKRKAI